MDGLKGAFFVESPALKGKYAADPIVQLSDWYHNNSNSLLQQVLLAE